MKLRRLSFCINKLLVFSGLLLLTIVIAIPAAANSLWDEKAAEIYKNEKMQFELGDVITVLIEEESDAVQNSGTSSGQDSSTDAAPGGILGFIANLGLEYSDEDSSEGEIEQSGEIEADITTQIIEKYDNGNFKIEGKKNIKVNNEEQTIIVSGIIRPDDINEDNTISSKKLADSFIEFEGKGTVREKQRPNLFQRILNWIF
ncbi:MAG: flagellar basal body L-ring protein FlgH [Halanaerobiales bacterium]